MQRGKFPSHSSKSPVCPAIFGGFIIFLLGILAYEANPISRTGIPISVMLQIMSCFYLAVTTPQAKPPFLAIAQTSSNNVPP
jgi:hypothetical protein